SSHYKVITAKAITALTSFEVLDTSTLGCLVLLSKTIDYMSSAQKSRVGFYAAFRYFAIPFISVYLLVSIYWYLSASIHTDFY
ncbi:hypothetical protein, partial [Psychrobacter sp. AOP29-E1-7]